LTVVYQIDAHCKRFLWVGEKRTVKTLLTFFHWLGSERSAALRFICSDMWKPYLKVIAKKAGQAIHVLDRFHIMGHFGTAIAEVRAQEARELRACGQEPVLTKTRWLLLKRSENLTVYLLDPHHAPAAGRARRIGRAPVQRPKTHYPVPRLVAQAPNEVWTWDMTKLASLFLSLYVVLDLYTAAS
jgi:hypothetical protein